MRDSNSRFILFAIALSASLAQPGRSETVFELVEQLVEVSAPDTGYSQFFSGSNFLPYKDSEQLGTLILGATQRENSPVLVELVEAGFSAVPELMEHLGDDRKVGLPPIESGGFMWIAFDNEYDFNRATMERAPQGVNLDSRGKAAEQPDRHAITIGDLCFVALGQIFNRHWSAN
ncbi:MAG: hypothetical protein AAGD07_23730 [Planctomycetota bacterium]